VLLHVCPLPHTSCAPHNTSQSLPKGWTTQDYITTPQGFKAHSYDNPGRCKVDTTYVQ